MIWTFGAFELDDGAYVLRRAGEVIPLRRKVFDVLRYLVAHAGALVTKEELLANVWPDEAIIEAVIPQNIAVLRQALGDSRASAKLIQTVHGKGYRFVAAVRVHDPQRRPRTGPAHLGLVGREHLLAELQGELQSASCGAGRVAIVQGAPGMGKTRLLHELERHARERGVCVISAHCQDTGGALPYRPWRELLRQLVAADVLPLEAARPVLARLGQEPGAMSVEPTPEDPRAALEARYRVFDSVSALIERASRARPLAILLDDLHWADRASLQLFAFVARELRALPVLLSGSSRLLEGVAPGDASAELAALLAETHVRRIALAGLSEAETGELAALGLGRALTPARVRELVAVTEGNPFFVLELMRLVHDAHGGEPDEQLPRHMRDVILLRVRRMGADVERVLMLAALIGCEFRLPVLEQLAGLSRAALLEALTCACDARLLRDFTSFSHALIQESLYESVPLAQRAGLHARVGRALEAVLGVDVDSCLGELAYHYTRAAPGGEAERAVLYCQCAAEHALRGLAFEQAVGHYRAALEALLLQLPVDEIRRFELKLGLGAALFRAGEDGSEAFEAASAIARSLRRPELIARVALALQGWPRLLRRGRTDHPALYPLLTEALAAPIADAGLRARLECALSLNTPPETPLREQIALSKNALELARQSSDSEVLHDALQARLRLLGGPDDLQQRLQLAQELLLLAERSRQPERLFQAHELCVQPWIAQGRLARADRAILECERLARRLNLPRFSLQVLRFRIQRALADGRFAEVQCLTREAVALRGCAPPSPSYLVSLYVWRSFERAWRGDRAFIERHIAALLPKVDQARLLRAHIAALCAAFGRAADARRCYVPLLEPGVLDDRADEDWLLTAIWTAEAAVACSDREAARALYPRLLPYAELNVTHVEWLVYFGACSRWLGSLAGLLGDHGAALAHFEHALAVNAGLGARPALALSYFEYARACAQLPGRREQAQSLAARARELALDLDMGGLQALNPLEIA